MTIEFALQFPKKNEGTQPKKIISQLTQIDIPEDCRYMVFLGNGNIEFFNNWASASVMTFFSDIIYLRSDKNISKKNIKRVEKFVLKRTIKKDSEVTGSYQEINGDLIQLAKEGFFDVITHGCNCCSNMGGGLALTMANEFGCNCFPKESSKYYKDKNKLGTIDIMLSAIPNFNLYVINSYTQFYPGVNGDYNAIKSCMYEINKAFKGKYIGLPQIGCGIAGLDWDYVREIIKEELKDCFVTIVMLK